MLRRSLFLFLVIPIIFCSCQKDDLNSNDSSGSGNNNAVVYNVNKATLLELVNNVRTSGCTCGATVMPPVAKLAWNDQLAKAGYDHSVDMKTNNYFSHTGLDGSDPGQRITAAGYTWHSYGENIANGFANEQDVMNGWLNSEGHCKNIMNAGFKDMGAGRSDGYWTQVFGSK